jgi:hypothetical protein
MSAAVITTICTTVVTLAGLLFGYLRLRLGVSNVNDKVEAVRKLAVNVQPDAESQERKR